MVKPFFILFPTFDTTLRTWFPSRRQAHKDLDDFLAMMEKIIENKRCVIREQKENNSLEDNEKDLLTLMIESEMNDGDGQVLSNEELKVVKKITWALVTVGYWLTNMERI